MSFWARWTPQLRPGQVPPSQIILPQISGATQTVNVATTDTDTVSFTVGRGRPILFASTDTDTVTFTVGATRQILLATTDTDTVTFTLGRGRPITLATSDTDTVTFTVLRSGAVVFGTTDTDTVSFSLTVTSFIYGLEMFMVNNDGRFVPTLTRFPDSYLPL